MPSKRRDPIDLAFYGLSFFFACAAVFHVVAALNPSVDPEAPAWRHLLFVGINVVCIVGFLKRPLVFLPLFTVLLVQQVASHGSHAVHAWCTSRSFDAPSVGVVIVMPLTLALLVVDAKRKHLARKRA